MPNFKKNPAPFRMNGYSYPGTSPMKQDKKTGSDKQLEQITKRNTAKAKSKSSWDIKGYLKGEQGLVPDYKGESTKKTVKTIKRKADIAADQIPYVGPSSSVYSTYAKAGGGSGIHHDPKATVNQPGYEKEKAQILKNKGWGTNKR